MSVNAIWFRGALVVACAALFAFVVGGPVWAEDEAAPAAEESVEAAPKVFETPEAAAAYAIEAAENNDTAALRAAAGAESADDVPDGSDPGVAKDRADFAKAAKAHLKINEVDENTRELVVGENLWPLPTPLRKTEGGWYFDYAAGAEEMRARRIGRNELRAIGICKGYVQAQREYASEDRDGDGVREYAQKVKSSEGQMDGLYWPDAEGQPQSPIGPFVTTIREMMGDEEIGDVLGGYVWRILHGQGPNAPGGRHTYVINGNMIAGFALIGTPAKYGESGIMTFVVSHHGPILEKDLGEEGLGFANGCRGFNPDDTWTEVGE